MGRLYYLIYRVVISLLLPAVLIRFLVVGCWRPQYWHRLTERIGLIPAKVTSGSIWVHAVSVGEVNAAKPLIDYLLDNFSAPVLMSCVTPTGAAQIARLFGDRVTQIYAPFDTGFAVGRTLRKVCPRALIIVETELWPTLLCTARAQSVPVALVNLRISDRTFKRARLLQPLSRYVIGNVASFCVQTDVDAERITGLGAPSERVYVAGNLKFDFELSSDIGETAALLRARWGATRDVIVLASSHDGEEREFAKLFAQLRATSPELLLLVVPRHPERFDNAIRQISGQGLTVLRRSQWSDKVSADVDVIVVDSMGELLEFYAAADIAVVGGSFVAAGGHNILEPLRVGTPAVFGPDMSNFREITRLALANDAGEQVNNFAQLGVALVKLLTDPALRQKRVANGLRLLEVHQGALAKTIDRLQPILDSA